MKKTTYTILLLLSVHFGFSQTEDDYKKVIDQITENYSTKDSEKLFNLFSSDLQATFTIDKVKEFIVTNHLEKGVMGESSFLMDEDNCKRYLTEFENSSMLLIICLSKNLKITKLELQEY
ncbi:hypothetical protein [Aquimarina pacifica]|uniref:hypothetical protein n=1 Tax=Aquimarina pacifica TaxID=1296415 RepID=UPI0004726E1E|nr:hypothetical protein [Aquimarina pacifica]